MTTETLNAPPVPEDKVVGDLRYLTQMTEYVRALAPTHFTTSEYENDVFSLHPYCWCDRDDCDWCLGCTCEDVFDYHLPDGSKVSEDEYWDDLTADERASVTRTLLSHRTCQACESGRQRKANFFHKPSGTSVSWYKHIGRGQTLDLRHPDWHTLIGECLASVTADHQALART